MPSARKRNRARNDSSKDHTRLELSNPDPKMYVAAPTTALLDERASWLGIKESHLKPEPSLSSPFKKTSLHDLRNYRPTRLEFVFPHTTGERKDEWFDYAFLDLFVRTKEFSQQRFGMDTLSGAKAGKSPWKKAGFSAEFIDYVSQVAQQDNLAGGWDALLVDPAQRACLVTGVLSKVWKDCIFSDLLFGATDAEKKHLRAHDESTLNTEGYLRTNMRAEIIRDALANKVITDCFWPKVDELATQTTTLLLPLINLQGKASPNTPWPSLAVVHQQIHNIVAEAAYLSICMRLSKTIFWITHPNPGDWWELEYRNAEPGLYELAKESTLAHDDEQQAQAVAAAQAASFREPAAAGVDVREARDESQREALKVQRAYRRPERTAKVKIVMWPLVKRHKPLGELGGKGAPDGERIAEICKSEVVYYYGETDSAAELLERHPSLASWMNRRRYPWLCNYWVAFFIVLMLLVAAAPVLAKHKHYHMPSWISWGSVTNAVQSLSLGLNG